jgi:hypothetical protein
MMGTGSVLKYLNPISSAATIPESLLDSQSDCLMEVALAIVFFMLPSMEKELGT